MEHPAYAGPPDIQRTLFVHHPTHAVCPTPNIQRTPVHPNVTVLLHQPAAGFNIRPGLDSIDLQTADHPSAVFLLPFKLFIASNLTCPPSFSLIYELILHPATANCQNVDGNKLANKIITYMIY
ncbi:hypothetical protein [Paenibacillus glycinis]|uniref:Uncharacterized protein n=1 Tax=Paenibacillus glycinis TaxID=2697035 RepID=A0ABW9XSE5_9BACL|nr:hypothetical protein [Paenibacillus glycinis]NBD25257.1 hypothetical protein [Paenibacillus glycinis]